MDVAELKAHLKAEVGDFLRNLEAADGGMENTRQNIRQLERTAQEAGRVLNEVKVSSAQAFESRAALETIERSVSSVSHTALITADHLNNVKVSQAQALETKVATDEIKADLDGVILKAEEARLALRRANGGVGAGGRGGRGGYDPIGINALGGLRGTAIAAGLGLAIPAAPELAAAALGLGAGAAGGAGALAGELGVVALALHGITAEAFKTQKAYDALAPSQKRIVDDLRSAGAGIGTRVASTARENVLPGLSAGLHEALSPTTTSAATAGVTALSQAAGHAAESWGRFIGGPFGTEFGALLQRDAGYIAPVNHEIQNMLDFVTQLLNVGGPFTDWLSRTADNAARGANEWAHSAAGVHDLSIAFDEARSGLQDVAHLLGGALDVIVALAEASSSANTLQLVAGALDEIATIINENRGELRSFFAGVDTSAHDVLAVAKALEQPLHVVVGMLDNVAGAIGGWRVPIDAVAAVWAARFVMNISWVAKLLGVVGLIGPETAGAAAEADAALATLTASAEAASAALAGIGPAAAVGAVEADAAIAATGAAAVATAGEVGGLRVALLGLGSPGVLAALAAAAAALLLIDEFSHHTKGHTQTGGSAKLNTEVFEQGGKYYERITVGRNVVTKEITAKKAAALLESPSPTHGPGSAHNFASDLHPPKINLTLPAGVQHQIDLAANSVKNQQDDVAAAHAAVAYYDRQLKQPHLTSAQTHELLQARALFASQASAFGTPGALTPDKSKGGGSTSGLNLLPTGLATSLLDAQAAAASAATPDATIKANQAIVAEAKKAVDYLDRQKATGKELVAIGRERVALEKEIATAKKDITAAEDAKTPQRWIVPLLLQLAQAKAAATPGNVDDIAAATRVKQAAEKALHAHHQSIEAQIDEWNAITAANQTLAGNAKGAIDTYHAVSTRAITSGLGLSRDQRVTLEERLAQSAAHRGFAPNGPSALGQGMTFTGPITIHGVHDVYELYSKLRRAGETVGQRRGAR